MKLVEAFAVLAAKFFPLTILGLVGFSIFLGLWGDTVILVVVAAFGVLFYIVIGLIYLIEIVCLI